MTVNNTDVRLKKEEKLEQFFFAHTRRDIAICNAKK